MWWLESPDNLISFVGALSETRYKKFSSSENVAWPLIDDLENFQFPPAGISAGVSSPARQGVSRPFPRTRTGSQMEKDPTTVP